MAIYLLPSNWHMEVRILAADNVSIFFYKNILRAE